MMIILSWLCLTALVITSQHVRSKVITIITTDGSDNATCCVDGECDCSSLSTVLRYINSSTTINITSQLVTLDQHIVMGSGDNITITGNGVTIACNNSGSVKLTCDNVCTDIVIEGITWDKCGDQTLHGVTLKTVANVSIINCVFKSSLKQAIAIEVVQGSVIIEGCSFILNRAGISVYLSQGFMKENSSLDRTVSISNSNFISNRGRYQYALILHKGRTQCAWNIIISKTKFILNTQAMYLYLTGGNVTLSEVLVHSSHNFLLRSVIIIFLGHQNHTTFLSILSSQFQENKNAVVRVLAKADITTLIKNSTFTENKSYRYPIANLISPNGSNCLLTLINVLIANNVVRQNYNIVTMGIFSVQFDCAKTTVAMKQVNVTLNMHSYGEKGLVHIQNTNTVVDINISESVFANNTSLVGSTLYFDQIKNSQNFNISISDSAFEGNTAQNGVVSINNIATAYWSVYGYFEKLKFINNFDVCIFLTQWCWINFHGDMSFVNNTADNGAALYLDQTSRVHISDGANVQFINNSVTSHGGAVFIEVKFFPMNALALNGISTVSFINNIARFGPNAVYFGILKYFDHNVFVNSSDPRSIMNVPYQFNYSQTINGTLTHIPTDYNYTWLNVSQFPVITSPHQLKLYDGDMQFYDNNHFIGNNVLGRPVTFRGIVLDYFDKPAEVTQFHLTCIDCSTNWSLLNIFLSVDNVSPLTMTLVGGKITNNSVNITISMLSSIKYIYDSIEATLIVELVPCHDHPGYYYSDTTKGCVCYHHDRVECYEHYSEIKRGYWFGSVNGLATTSLCPNQYCQFDHNRKKTRDGYYMLPKKVNEQCNHRRSGSACGECSPGYTLAYDSTDCISVDNCSAGITVLVVVLTCLYWITIIAVTFLLVAYVKFRISSGYVYGIVYYYSMVGILLSENPYISDGALIFINIISGFVQLTPQLLGQLCFAQGLSGIDQLFFHYIHDVAILLFLIVFILVVKQSRKISILGFIARNIIPVISLLLLLFYTSLTSTSLRLLWPLTFTDINEVYTHSSPNIKYFTGRHAFYGVVAVMWELAIGIGLPVILIMEPCLRRKLNLVKFKAFLDEYGNCYKDKYRWFASYYLVCRQLIVLFLLVFGNRRITMTFSLLITCLVITTIHVSIRPYKSKLINIFDGFILQLMVVIVALSAFDFLQSVITELSVILVMLPLPLLCIAVLIVKVMARTRHHINKSSPIRNKPNIKSSHRGYAYYQESLLDITADQS